MSPARVECQSGYTFILKKGEELGKHSAHFDELPFSEKEDLKGWLSIYGTTNGYRVAVWKLVDVTVFVAPTRVCSSPPGHKEDIKLTEGNVFTLRGGTKIIPIGK